MNSYAYDTFGTLDNAEFLDEDPHNFLYGDGYGSLSPNGDDDG